MTEQQSNELMGKISENRIIEGRITLQLDGTWKVSVQFTEPVRGGIHSAVDVLRGMVTLSAGARTDL